MTDKHEDQLPSEDTRLRHVGSDCELEQTVVLNQERESETSSDFRDDDIALQSDTLSGVSHVVLRDPYEEGDEPILRPASAEMPGRNSNRRYRLDGEIARGGIGAILQGKDIDLGRDLAIKVLLDRHKENPDVVQRFIEEAQIAGQLQHPGIAPVYELVPFCGPASLL